MWREIVFLWLALGIIAWAFWEGTKDTRGKK